MTQRVIMARFLSAAPPLEQNANQNGKKNISAKMYDRTLSKLFCYCLLNDEIN